MLDQDFKEKATDIILEAEVTLNQKAITRTSIIDAHDAVAGMPADVANVFRWYAIYVTPGTETKVRNAILHHAVKNSAEASFEEVWVPVFAQETIKRGKNVIVEHNALPGYIFLKMKQNTESLLAIKLSTKIINFLGSNTLRQISEAEIDKMRAGLNISKSNVHNIYEIGDAVKILDGVFASLSGVIQDIDLDKKRLHVAVTILGRATPLDLGFDQVAKTTT